MKRIVCFIIILALNMLFVSCNSDISQEILTNGNYKYWLIKKKGYKGKSQFITYFDKNGKSLLFIKYYNGKFERYDSGDIQLINKWHRKDDKHIIWGGKDFEILKNTVDLLILKSNVIDTLVSAPANLIPLEFKKIQ